MLMMSFVFWCYNVVFDVKQAMLIILCALPGEAAGLALGLVMLGSKSAQAIEDMVGYAQETQHEKILRGLAVGIALVMYGRMEEADALIESLCRDKVRQKYPQTAHPLLLRSELLHNQVAVFDFCGYSAAYHVLT